MGGLAKRELGRDSSARFRRDRSDYRRSGCDNLAVPVCAGRVSAFVDRGVADEKEAAGF